MEISEQVIKVLDAVCDKFGIAIDWTSNNVIPYIEQLGNKIVTYDIYMSIMWLVVGCIPLTIAFLIKKFLNKKKLEAKDKPNDYYFTDGSLNGAEDSYFIIGILLVVAIVIGIANIQGIIQDIIFPEKTIIEFITPYM